MNSDVIIMSKQIRIKAVTVGETGVGKSSLLLRFVNDHFDECSQPTLGAAFLSKTLHYGTDQTVRLQLWDTAGQEKYKSIAPIYYRDSQVALCVYDISDRNSFEVMKKWVSELKALGPKDILLAIIGNKIDLIDHELVPYEQAKNYARENDAIFKLVSAKDGKGVNQLFHCIIEQYLQREKKVKPRYAHGGPLLPRDPVKQPKTTCC